MTLEPRAIAIGLPRRPSGRHRRMIGLASVLAVVAAVTVAGGLWLRADNRTSTTAVEHAPPAGVAAPAARVAPVDDILTVNIVDAQEEKVRLEQGLDEANVSRVLAGERPLANEFVLVAATDAEAHRIVQAVTGNVDVVKFDFNDLRAPTAAPATTE